MLSIVILCSTPPCLHNPPKKRSVAAADVQGLSMFWFKMFSASENLILDIAVWLEVYLLSYFSIPTVLGGAVALRPWLAPRGRSTT